MINCIIIDDEPYALEVLKNHIQKISTIKLIGAYSDAVPALTELNKKTVDLVFCDVEMPDINGFQFIESINSNKRPLFVIVSAHDRYAIEGFNLDVIDYLLKPVPFSRFLKTIQKVTEHLSEYKNRTEHIPSVNPSTEETRNNFLFVKSNNKLQKINFGNIIYIESMSDYIKINTDNSNRSILSLSSLKNIEEMLPANLFKRIHRSYIVSLSKIKAIENRKVFLDNNLSLPISNSYYDELYNSFVSDNILK